MDERILIVEDDAVFAEYLTKLLGAASPDFRVETVSTAARALEHCRRRAVDLVLLDLGLSDSRGFRCLDALRSERPSLPIVVITADSRVETAVEAIKHGAYDFLPKEPHYLRNVAGKVSEILARRALGEHLGAVNECLSRSGLAIAGSSQALREVVKTLVRLAGTPFAVLLEGETGVGKELFARALHGLSSRAAQPYVPVNCAAIPEGLIASQLFGYVRGSFTGAASDHPGLFVAANHGTLFLDEITEASRLVHAGLLRALNDGEITPIGSVVPRHVDVRVVSATNRNLEDEVRDRRFPEDLLYRLGIRLRIPALRERLEDIPVIGERILERIAARMDRPVSRLAPEAIALLQDYGYPGNVRELERILEATVLHLEPGETITAGRLPRLGSRAPAIPVIDHGRDPEDPEPRPAPSALEAAREAVLQYAQRVARLERTAIEAVLGAAADAPARTLKAIVRDLERLYVEAVWRASDGSVETAAVRLGLTGRGLRKKMAALGLSLRRRRRGGGGGGESGPSSTPAPSPS